ncbi:hypothetical protein GCM10010193_43570 [Kitasatospora atroaurantiaca]|uniref:Uncharacterized protein n=1 Tax=Kitasatospora atroaurantiaca TaxID=285545 RepID=A0A561ETP1_9ACTN|nr:hypothetical protein FB465_4076 [Kitasatospora atroaurantiaca]
MAYVIELGYSLSNRFPDPPQTDYRDASVRSLRHDLFCGDVFLEADGLDLSTRWGWVPVLDFAWALCDTVEALDSDPRGSRSAAVQTFDLDFTQNTELLRFARRFGLVEISATWLPDDPPAVVRHAELRREARDFLQDVLADLTDMHDGLGENPNIWTLQGRFPRV